MTTTTDRRFVVVSGLPGSGKTTLARQLAPAVGLPLIDKDDLLERLFESKGVGDAAWRRVLSREADVMLQSKASASDGAVLSSMWHVDGMATNSGTPTNWLAGLSSRVIEVHCACSPEIAAKRFIERQRHTGHLDNSATYESILNSLRLQANGGRLRVGPRVVVDTTEYPTIASVLADVRRALALA